jgi:prepilin-type N-terminal cleavage/methylation domain-containing protein/prepilin-type processing-associated H-X9-DG protein
MGRIIPSCEASSIWTGDMRMGVAVRGRRIVSPRVIDERTGSGSITMSGGTEVRTNCLRRCGFSLIELLVVVAIIALLLAILLPSLRKAKEQARSTTCKSNVRQLVLGMTMYLQEYHAFPAHQWKLSDGSRVRWFQAMSKPLSGEEIERCPAETWPVGRNNSYGYNYKYLGSARENAVGPTAPWERFPVRSVKAPSRTIAFGDSDGTGWKLPHDADCQSSDAGSDCFDRFGNHGYTLDPTYLPEFSMETKGEPYASKNYRTYISTRHPEKSNLSFADGHVEGKRPDQVYIDNRYWNGLGGEDPERDPHVTFKFLDGAWRFPGV